MAPTKAAEGCTLTCRTRSDQDPEVLNALASQKASLQCSVSGTGLCGEAADSMQMNDAIYSTIVLLVCLAQGVCMGIDMATGLMW